ncbi:unnamed protein product [Rotaria magnacalcarata]|uniref:Uncharacterized protein n=1 Tax=Rotaria magnacalcarata TaxID=392030 RepID=A0A815IBG9_9BILA|nr:unnamed protein product [Rotaria magnacalcarata]CAF3950232.1 unnamed protein product [Rotaria magnacalcarata]CAF3972398.1 unnamed protein product [Rotaria magnacalcarata]CAF4018331.1 unnamed protein product [Rotaria magnacalcarata]CAF5190522.1 unnamed protein product [Rotaria magnacalcarata]
MDVSSYEAQFSGMVHSLSLEPHKLNYNDWFMLVMKLTKDDNSFREMSLSYSDEFNQNYLNYPESLFGKQFRLTSLTITDSLKDESVQIEL